MCDRGRVRVHMREKAHVRARIRMPRSKQARTSARGVLCTCLRVFHISSQKGKGGS